jgi:hypothetical protein
MDRHRRGRSMARCSDGPSDEAWVVDVKVITFGVMDDDDVDAADPLPKATSVLVLRVTPPKSDDA